MSTPAAVEYHRFSVEDVLTGKTAGWERCDEEWFGGTWYRRPAVQEPDGG